MCSSMVSTFETRSFWPLVDEPDADAMPAASWRRHVSHGAVVFTVRPLSNWIAAEAKIRAPRIATRPAAGPWGKRDDLFSSCGCLGAHQDGRRRRRLGEKGRGRFRFGVAVCPGGDRDGGLFDLVNCNHPGGQKPEHNADATWDATVAMLPASDAPRTDAE